MTQSPTPAGERPTPPLSVATIDSLFVHLVAHWHHFEVEHSESGLRGSICDLHRFNFLLWHEEDIARSPAVTDGRIAQVKRAIDRYNQARNDAIEKVDDHLIAELAARGVVAAPTAPVGSGPLVATNCTTTPASPADEVVKLPPPAPEKVAALAAARSAP